MARRPAELDDREWLIERAGQSTYQTADELGCSQTAVMLAYQRMGVPLRANTEAVSDANFQHGHGNNLKGAYNSWRSMLGRCKNPGDQSYATYGGAGIEVCPRWMEPRGAGFLNFLEDMGERPEGRTLDRVDPYGNYEPSNCRWATPLEQRRAGGRRDGIGAVANLRRVPVTCTVCGHKFARGSKNIVAGASKDKGRCKNRAACDKRKEAHTYK